MPVRSTLLPLVGALALLPIGAYFLYRPELGAALSVLSTILIIASVIAMVRPEREQRGKVFGPGPS